MPETGVDCQHLDYESQLHKGLRWEAKALSGHISVPCFLKSLYALSLGAAWACFVYGLLTRGKEM